MPRQATKRQIAQTLQRCERIKSAQSPTYGALRGGNVVYEPEGPLPRRRSGRRDGWGL